MKRIRRADTRPELIVRRALYARGFRYTLHPRDLPGRPDVSFKQRQKIIFVHGCFWHRHEGCRKATFPKTRPDFWQEKFLRNIERDHRKIRELRDLGFDAIVVWECETAKMEVLLPRLEAFLGSPSVR